MASGEEYDVVAKITLDASEAKREAKRVATEMRGVEKATKSADLATKSAGKAAAVAGRASKRAGEAAKKQADGMQAAMAGMGRSLSGVSGSANNLVSSLLGIGLAYAGFRAAVGTTRALVGSQLAYASSIEKTRIGLTSVLQAVEGGEWDAAAKRSDAAFQALRQAAIESTATTGELFDIFQGIVGPIERAGYGLDTVLKITKDTVNASGALNVDLAQAQRDITAMVRGAAGIDVKLFSMLRSTGAIAETTEQWNQNLSAGQRVEKLQAALAKFAPAGKAFASSWAGVTSTFKDIAQEMGRTAFQPVLAVMSRALLGVNNSIMAHQTQIEDFFRAHGEQFAAALERNIDRAGKAFAYLTSHWDQISDKIAEVVAQVQHVAPILLKAALAFSVVKAGTGVTGAAIGVAGRARGMIAGLAELAPVAAASVGAASVGAAGAGVAGVGAAGAAGAAVAGGGAGAGFAALMTALAPVLAAVAVAVVALGAVFVAAGDQLSSLKQIFGTMTAGLLDDLMQLAGVIWIAVRPVLKLFGGVLLAGLVVSLQLVIAVVRLAVAGFTAFYWVVAQITNAIYDTLKPAFDFVFSLFVQFGEFLMGWVRRIAGAIGVPLSHGGPGLTPTLDRMNGPEAAPYNPAGGEVKDFSALYGGIGNGVGKGEGLGGPISSGVPEARGGSGTTNNNDFRGSHIKIEQKFEGDYDPDRIVYAALDQLTRMAESRITSSYQGALTG